MTDFTEDQVDDWVSAVHQLYENTVTNATDVRTAEEAAANLWSGFGYLDAPTHVLRMMALATATGYGAAIRDVRDGRLVVEG
jgi:hypothetical protein